MGDLRSFPRGSLAVVVGAGGAIGQALSARLAADKSFGKVAGFSRTSTTALDVTSEGDVAAAAELVDAIGLPLRLVVDATGFLHGEEMSPEKSWRQIDARHMAHAFAVNAIGPALLMKHLLPRLAPDGKSVFATLSAKVGSIGDNRLGGWYSYRASKAALNQIVRTAAIELRRRAPESIAVALHPGTVASALSAPFGKGGLEVRSPSLAAAQLLTVIDGFTAAASGGFFDYRGEALPS